MKDQKEDFRLHLFKKLVLEKGRVATYEFTKPIQLLLNASKVFKNPDTVQEVAYDLLYCVAPLTAGSCNLICESLV